MKQRSPESEIRRLRSELKRAKSDLLAADRKLSICLMAMVLMSKHMSVYASTMQAEDPLKDLLLLWSKELKDAVGRAV